MATKSRLVLSAVAALVFASATVSTQGPPKPKRYNEVIALLEQGKVVFGASGKANKDWALDAAVNNLVDFVFYDFEHAPFDVPTLRDFLQYMIDPARAARTGGTFKPVLVRITQPGREVTHWMVQNTLSSGAHGISTPHVDTGAEARHSIEMMESPNGGTASRVWGLTGPEFRAKAKLWPANPQGEMLFMPMIESKEGVDNARDILSAPGVGIVMIGSGSLNDSYLGDAKKTEEGIQKVLVLSKELKIPLAIPISPANVEQRFKEGFRVLISGGIYGAAAEALAIGHRVAGR